MITAADSILRSDSLRRAVEQMFVQGARFTPVETTDTLQAVVVPPATAADLFGAGSMLAPQTATASAMLPLSANPLFQAFVLLMAAAYALLIYRHAGDLSALVLKPSSKSVSVSDLRGHTHFLNLTGMVGLLLAGVLCVRYTDLLFAPGMLPYQAAAGVSLIVTSALLLVVAVQAGLLKLIGIVTLTQDFIRELFSIRRAALAFATIAVAPALLFFVLSPGGSGQIWSYMILSELVVVLIFFLRKTLLLFLSKKISILHWFLYLCAVEIFPVSLLWLLIIRNE